MENCCKTPLRANEIARKDKNFMSDFGKSEIPLSDWP